MTTPARLAIRLGLLSLLFIAGLTQLRADTYTVIGPPKIIVLRSEDQVVAASAKTEESFSAQHVLIQLALLGHPTSVEPAPRSNKNVFAPLVEDCPAWLVSAPIPAVTADDLIAARRVLERLGFPDEDIATKLVDLPAKYCAAQSAGVAARVGQILVAIQPNAEAKFSEAVKALSAAVARIPNLRPAGIVQLRDTCDSEQGLLARTEREAKARARMLASVASLELASQRGTDSAAKTSHDANQLQGFCGPDAAPVLSPEAGGYIQNPAPPYFVSAGHSDVFAAKTSVTKRLSSAVPRFIESTTLPDSSQGIVSYGFHILADEPFVSAQGAFRALVRPDVLVATFWISMPAPQPSPLQILSEVVQALHDVGIPDARIRLHQGRAPYLTVRLKFEDEKLLATVQRRMKIAALHYSLAVFVRDCDTVARAVAQRAFGNALERAQIMASAAQLRVGPVIAVDDAGQLRDAICGYGADATTDALDRAVSRPTPPHFARAYAEFGSDVAVAWRLNGVGPMTLSTSTPSFAPPYALANVNQAFATEGDGILGSASVFPEPTRAYIMISTGVADERRLLEVRPADPPSVKKTVTRLRSRGVAVENILFRDEHCTAEDLRALRQAEIGALAFVERKPVYALIDQGTVYRPEDEICRLTTEGGLYVGGSYDSYDRLQYTMQHRVLVITGSPP